MTRMRAQSFDEFISTVAACLDPAVASGRIIAFDDRGIGIVTVRIDNLRPAVQDEIDNLLAIRPAAIAVCVRNEQSWQITAVCPELPARFVEQPDGQPFHELAPEQAPLAMLSLVSGLRWALDGLAPWRVPALHG